MPQSRSKRPANSKQNFLAIGGLVLLLVVAAFFAALKICTWQSQKDVASSVVYTQPTFLYVQTFGSGTLSAPQADGTRTLTLADVSPTTISFAERPDREVAHESTEAFIRGWDQGEDSFMNNPPNAALDIIGQDSQSIVIVELVDAQYDLTAQTLEYQVIILDDEHREDLPQSFEEAVLFIDSTFKDYKCSCTPPDGQNFCKCHYSYKLGKSATKEFRGYCTGAAKDPMDIFITRASDTTSCTMTARFGKRLSKSCTNWSPLSSDRIDVTVICDK